MVTSKKRNELCIRIPACAGMTDAGNYQPDRQSQCALPEKKRNEHCIRIPACAGMTAMGYWTDIAVIVCHCSTGSVIVNYSHHATLPRHCRPIGNRNAFYRKKEEEHALH